MKHIQWFFYALATLLVFAVFTAMNGPGHIFLTDNLILPKSVEKLTGIPDIAKMPDIPSDSLQDNANHFPAGQAAVPVVFPAAAMPVASDAPNTALPQLHRPFYPYPDHFMLHKMGSDSGPVLLIVGGIQGDEPGAFSAAALVASHYKITKGAVWVVPDLNFPSILQRCRGLFGDMNRKFAALSPDDPEYESIRRIKSILLDEKVALVLNLHDGSGFYRPTYEDKLRNPKRWGQSLIIDQDIIETDGISHLLGMAQNAAADVNKVLVDPLHRYYIHNTNTALGDKEMAKTLSYFAVRNGKAAFGVEASKEFSTEYRSYYHLQIIESFMRQMGIEFERNFDLSPKGVLTALNSNLHFDAYDKRLVLHLDNVRPRLSHVPFKKNANLEISASKPLLALVREQGEGWRVAYGNRTITRIQPEYMDFDYSLDSLGMELDGKPYSVHMGELISVKDSFRVMCQHGYRVNAIGARKNVNGTENQVLLKRADFSADYSVDKSATTFRVELYKDDSFAGMVLVRFGDATLTAGQPLTAVSGPESKLGF